VTGTSSPPSIGPTIAPAWLTVMFSEVAAAIVPSGTMRAVTAVRVGWLTAKKACWTAKTRSSSQTLSRPDAAWAQKARALAIMPIVVISRSFRRSIRSDRAPP
jgi:hypothetical protein